jgi:putative protease
MAATGLFELTTTLSNLRDLAASDLEAYDAVYLGNIYCARYEDNLVERPAALAEAVRRVRDRGRRAYVTTPAAPRSRDLEVVRRALAAAVPAGAEAVEAHAPGLARLVRGEFPDLALHLGSFANVYTDAGAAVYRALGAARLAPPPELPLDEAGVLAACGGVPLEITVHGKVPLGVSGTCLLLAEAAAWDVDCPALCQQDVLLRRDDWVLKSVGTGVLTGHDVCLLEHLPRLVRDGHRHFRVETWSESPAYRRAVGAVYREALARAFAGDTAVDPAWWPPLHAHARAGLCNGFAFGRSGREYIGASPAGGRGDAS